MCIRDSRQVAARVARGVDRDHVLGIAAHAVLGAEQRGDLEIAARAEQVDRVAQIAVDRGGVDQEADAPALEQRAAVVRQPLQTRLYGHRASYAKIGTGLRVTLPSFMTTRNRTARHLSLIHISEPTRLLS